MRMIRTTGATVLVLALLACSPAGDTEVDASAADGATQPDADGAATEAEGAAADAAGDDSARAEGPRPMLQLSAWRSRGEEGATYATYLDDERRYRDLKNGEPHQEGEWEVREDGALCFLPDGENVRGDCWEIDRPDKDGVMIATHSSGRRIELQRIDYQPPEDE